MIRGKVKELKTIHTKARGINRFSSLFFREKSEKYLNLGIILAYIPKKQYFCAQIFKNTNYEENFPVFSIYCCNSCDVSG